MNASAPALKVRAAKDVGFTPGRWASTAVRALPSVAVLYNFALLSRGGFASFASSGAAEAGGMVLLLLGVGIAVTRRVRRAVHAATVGLRDELELGGGMLALAFAVVSMVGQPFYPLIYLVMAGLVAFLSRPAGATLLFAAILFDAVMLMDSRPATFVMHAVFLGLFAGLYHLVLAARIAAARYAENAAVRKRIQEVEERARTYRLVSSGTRDSLPGVQDHEKWLLASVKEIEGTLGSVLEVAELSLRTHTCGVFLLTSDDKHLKLHDCRSASELVQRERFAAGEGILGALLKRGSPVRMHSVAGLRGVTHYESGGPTVCALLAVPIVEASGLMRGVVVADRVSPEAFTDNDEQLLTALATEVLRAMEVERVMGYIRKNRDEKDRFFRAIEELNRANAPDQVFLAVLESARQIAPLDFCAVTLVADEGKERFHRIARMTGVTAQGRALEGVRFKDNNGLVANVVRYGAPLPGREVGAMDRQVIFDDDTQVRGLASLKIFPLTAGQRILGTLVTGSRKRGAIDDDGFRMLEVLAIQAAQAVLRAQLYEQMELMATTDGLTGLLNHRTFQGRFEDAVASARRYTRKASLILTDIDHFKSVNDTYGHPTGDTVLRGVAQILRRVARDTDVVARYGGEEFALVMPETDSAGAHVIAERIREAVGNEIFQTDQGPLKVTISLGIATFPDAANEKQAIIDLADQCLYFAKRHGRNRSVTVAQMQGKKGS